MKRVYTKWMAAEDRFLLAVDSSAGTDDCWPWTGASRIREMHAAGIKTTPIARQFGIDPSTVRRIVSGKSWLADACRAAAEVDP